MQKVIWVVEMIHITPQMLVSCRTIKGLSYGTITDPRATTVGTVQANSKGLATGIWDPVTGLLVHRK